MILFSFLIVLGVGVAGVFLRSPAPEWQVTAGAPPSSTEPSAQKTAPHFSSVLLPVSAPSNHSSNIILLADGTPLVVWFAGAREGATDVQLVMARRQNGAWSQAEPIQTVEGNVRAFGHYTKKIGNPVLFADVESGKHKKIHLVFVTVALGGWGGSRIAHSVSEDEGRTWSPPQLWVTSPFLNISTQIRHPPLPITFADGKTGWLLPAHHEFMQKFPEMLLLDAEGNFLTKQRIPVGKKLIQPNFVAADEKNGVRNVRAFFRPTGAQNQVMTASYQSAWDSALQGTALPNPNAGISVIRLSDGRWLQALNPSVENRHRLSMAVSDNGIDWRIVADVENGADDKEYSYPSLVARGDDIHLTYSYLRQAIKHVQFNTAWLDQQRANTLAH